MKQALLSFISFVAILLATQMSGQAQEISEAEVMQLMNNSCSLHKNGRYQEALAGYLKIGELTKLQRTEEEHQVYAYSQTMAAMCYESLEQYKEGFELAETALGGKLSDAERDDLQPLYVTCGYLYALDYLKRGNNKHPDARNVLYKILPFANDEMSQLISQKIPLLWYFEGLEHYEIQQWDEALACFENALSGFHETDMRPNEMKTLYLIGSSKNWLHDWQGALRSYISAENLAEKEEDKLMLLKEQYEICNALGDHEATLAVFRKIDAFPSQPDNPKYIFEYNDFMGDRSMAQGQYIMAERWYLRNESLLPLLSDAAAFHGHYSNLRSLYSKTGQLDQALHYAHLEKQEFQKGYSPSEAGYYTPYVQLTDLYCRKGDSLSCFHQIDTLFRAIPLVDEPRELQHIYYARARAYASFGNYEGALADYRKAEELMASKYDETDADRVTLFALLGGVEHHLRNNEEAEKLYSKYAEILLRIEGENSRRYINALGYKANAEAFAGHIDRACYDYSVAVEKLKGEIRDKWSYLSSVEREAYWHQSSEWFQNMTSFALKAEQFQTPFTQTCYDGLVLTKSFLLESELSTFDLIKHHGSQQDADAYSSILALRDKIRDWERDGQNNADSILVASSILRKRESDLSSQCRTFGDAMAFMDIDYAKIQDALGENDFLLDFTDFISESRGRIYAAYIVNKRQRYPLLKEFFPEREIDALSVREPYQFYSGKYAETLYNLLWAPLKSLVKEGATVYYVPTQMLYQIALESLPAGDGTLLGEHYTFVRLSSARELVRYKPSLDLGRSNSTTAVLYGGLKYSLDGTIMAQEARKHDIPRMLVFRGGDERLKGQKLFDDLPGTQEEIDSIYTALQTAELTVHPYSGKEGTEESFLSLSGEAPLILHMATHGFYYTPDAAQNVDYLRGYTDAMSLSGLVLAGGNAAWMGQELPEDVLGGILTAADIARMDLTGVEMVVLSACHSGKGEATPEGLYGLQRAFKKAGVKTVVMSLWAESDVVGPEFMTLFYKNLVGKSEWDKRKAFDAAKDAIRKKYPDSPSYWAGFVMLD